MFWRSWSSSPLPGLARLPSERAVRTLGKHPIKYQTPCSELQLEVRLLKKMSVLCPTTCCPSHWTLTGFLPYVLFLCVSHIGVAERRSKKVCPLPLLSGEVCAWMGCMHAVSSFAHSGRRSEGQRGGMILAAQPHTVLKSRGNLMLN